MAPSYILIHAFGTLRDELDRADRGKRTYSAWLREYVEDTPRRLTEIAWLPFAVALLLWTGMLLARSHGWANALRASYPNSDVDDRFIAASFLAGAGFNAILPAHAGDAVKVFLAKKSIPRSSYPAVASSFAVLAPFDTTIGILVLGYALTLGLLPALPRIPDLPAFDIAFWAEHPERLLLFLTVLGIGLLLSAVNVRYRDVRYMIPIFLQVLPLLSGVMFAVDQIPEKWQWILSLNPMTTVISGWRWAQPAQAGARGASTEADNL